MRDRHLVTAPRLRLMATRAAIDAMRACGDNHRLWPRAAAIAGLRAAGAEALDRKRAHRRSVVGWWIAFTAFGLASGVADIVEAPQGELMLVMVAAGLCLAQMLYHLGAMIVLRDLARALVEPDPQASDDD